ncbi:hypothetical protein AAG747_15055 [Rapidithrix thailandica]|uniref:DKNYY family protein n=1 Tax=Rapidithrix thailandica TaxID=413964 RepID=A0AAW9S8A1_9BACT
MKIQVLSILLCSWVTLGVCEGRSDTLRYVLIEGEKLYHKEAALAPNKIPIKRYLLNQNERIATDTLYTNIFGRNWNIHNDYIYEFRVTPWRGHTYPYRPEYLVSMFQKNVLNPRYHTELPKKERKCSVCNPLTMYSGSFDYDWEGYGEYKKYKGKLVRTTNNIPHEEARAKDKLIMEQVNADVFFKNDSMYSLVWDPQGLYLWKSDSLFVKKIKDWKVIKAITIRKLNWDFPPFARLSLKKGENLYRTLKDPEMLKGNFKVFSQAGEIYFLNRISGKLYWLAAKKVYELGKVDMENYPELNDRKLFIENRDTGELVLLSPVRWKKRLFKSVPRPKVSVMSKEEIAEKYPMLAGA